MKTISIVQIFSLAFFVCCIAPCASLNAAAASENKAKRLKIDTSSSLAIASEEIRIEDLRALLQSPVVDSEDFVKKLENFLSISGNNLEMKTEFGDVNLLHTASARGHRAIVQLLLDRKADIKAQYETGWNSLHCAVHQGHTDVATLLLEKGADKDCENLDGETPLSVAAARGHIDLVKLLIRYGADKDRRRKDGLNTLFEILLRTDYANRSQKEVFSFLLQAGLDCNFYGEKTMLNLLIDYSDYYVFTANSGESQRALFKELLSEGANPKLLGKCILDSTEPAVMWDSIKLVKLNGEPKINKALKDEMEKRAIEPKASVQLGSMVNMVYEECILHEQKILGERGLAEIIARYGQSSRNARLEKDEKS